MPVTFTDEAPPDAGSVGSVTFAEPPRWQQPLPPSNAQALERGALLGTRATTEGLMGLPAMALDALTWPGRAAIRYFGGSATAPSDLVAQGLDSAGLPKPETAGEKITSGVVSGAAGAIPAVVTGGVLAAPGASATARAIGDVLASQPIRQAISGGLAGGASGTAAAVHAPPWMVTGAGLATGALTGLVPGATTGFSSAADTALAQVARDKYAIPVFPGQLGTGLTKYAFSVTGKIPGSGGATALRDQQNAYNAAVGRTFGAIADDGKLTPTAMSNAWTDNSKGFQNIARNTTVRLDPPLDSDLQQAASNAAMGLPTNEAQPVLNQVQAIRDVAAKNNGVIPSSWLIDTLGVKSALSRGAMGSGTAKEYFGDIRDALNDVLVRHASSNDVAGLLQARDNWRNMRTVERLVAKGNGDVSPGSLSNAVAANKYQNAAYQQRDLAELGEIGKRFVKGPPESGTLERGAVGAGLLGLGALGEHLMMGDITDVANKAAAAGGSYLGGVGAQQLMQRGALAPQPPSLLQYYARMLANPAAYGQ